VPSAQIESIAKSLPELGVRTRNSPPRKRRLKRNSDKGKRCTGLREQAATSVVERADSASDCSMGCATRRTTKTDQHTRVSRKIKAPGRYCNRSRLRYPLSRRRRRSFRRSARRF
jgi:hypothetical protein